MTVTVSFANAGSGVVFFAGTGTVAQFLNANPNIPISLSTTGLTADNLTSLGLLTEGGDTVWRIANSGSAATATLSRYGGSFTPMVLSLPEDSITFVRGGSAGTYQLSGDIVNTKASGPQLVSEIAPLPSNVPYNITGSAFNDTLHGGGNTDTIFGGAGDDVLHGLNGADIIYGEDGNDSLNGGSGNDTLFGGGGNDTLFGSGGNDTLTGGAGADRFTYNNTNQGVDTIDDFNTAELDLIQISASGTGFSGSGLTPGFLPHTQFLKGAGVVAATDNDQRFLYNTTDGALRFDRDGNLGGFAPVLLANLTNLPAAFDHSYIVIV